MRAHRLRRLRLLTQGVALLGLGGAEAACHDPPDTIHINAPYEAIARPRVTDIAWQAFDANAYSSVQLDRAAELWSTRAVQELHSLASFTELCGKLQSFGAPLDWSGAFARMIADEVRHTDLCLRMCEALGRPATPEIDPSDLQLLDQASSRGSLRQLVIALFCIGETISGRMFRHALRHTTVPLAREVVAAIVNEPGPNFGTLSASGYARCFFDGMREDVVPGLVSIGLPEAEPAYAELLLTLSQAG
jgi:hypothetical protein